MGGLSRGLTAACADRDMLVIAGEATAAGLEPLKWVPHPSTALRTGSGWSLRASARELPISPPLIRRAWFVNFSFRREKKLPAARGFCDIRSAKMATDQTIIEPATLEDLPVLTDLLIDLFTMEPDFEPDRAKQMRGLRLILEQPSRGRIFVLRHNGRILGMVNLLFTISTAEGGFVILLEDTVVQKEFRGQGFGSQLIRYAIDFAKQKGFLRITLLTDSLSEESQRFYKKHGFYASSMVPMRLMLAPGQANGVAQL
jgi:GNAT superfamily N-acetyltransferase